MQQGDSGGQTGPPSYVEVLVRDPLSAVTRKERLYLLAVSMIGIAMVWTGLVPSKIATFGIELDKPNRQALLFLLALVTLYFLCAFVIYALSDLVARREAVNTAIKVAPDWKTTNELDRPTPSLGQTSVAVIRIGFEFLLPPIVGVLAIAVLVANALA